MSQIELVDDGDEREHLKRGEPILNAERMKKNGMTYRESERGGVELHYDGGKYPVDILLERDVITGDQHRAAMQVIHARLGIAKGLGVEKFTARMVSVHEETPVAIMAPGKFLEAAFSNLNPWQRNLVDLITALPRGDNDRHRTLVAKDSAWLSHCCNSVRSALDVMKKNIDAVLGYS